MRRAGRFDQTLTTFLLLLRTLNILTCDSYLWNSSSRGWTFQDAKGSTWNIIAPTPILQLKSSRHRAQRLHQNKGCLIWSCTYTKAILNEVAPKQRLSYLKLHLNKGYLVLKMGPLKLLFYLTFVNWCTNGESPNKIQNVKLNVFGWNEMPREDLSFWEQI